MKPPKCRLCEHEHRNNEPHVFDGVMRNRLVTTPRNQSVTNPVNKVVTCNQCAAKDAEIAKLRAQVLELMKRPVLTGPKKAKRDRAAYMRERRAKQKGFIGIAYG